MAIYKINPLAEGGYPNVKIAQAISGGGSGTATALQTLTAKNISAAADPTNGQVLTYNGTTWAPATVTGTGTVTSVGVSGANGIGVSGSPVTTSGTIALSLGAITPTSINGNTITAGTGTLTLGSNTLTVANTGTAVTGTSLTSGNVIIGAGGSAIQDGGFATQAINAMTDTWNNAGTTFNAIKMNVTNTASAAGSALINLQVAGVDTFAIRKDGVLTAGTIPAANLSGTLAAAQEPAHTGDVTNSAGSLATTLATVNSNVGSFTNANITVNAKGLVTAASNGSGGSGTVTSIATTSPISGGTITTTGTISLLTNVDFSFTAAQTYTLAPAANTASTGILLTDTTAASSGNQQYSPALRFTGQGWKTTATAASQAVDYQIYNVPVQGAANPTGLLTINSSVNGGAFSNAFTIDTSGNVATTGSYSTSGSGSSGRFLAGDGANGTASFSFQSQSFGFWRVASNTLGITTSSGGFSVFEVSTPGTGVGAYVGGSNMGIGWGSVTLQPRISNLDTQLSRNAAGVVEINNGTVGTFRDLKVRQHYVDATLTGSGTTGNQTINKAAGSVRIAAAGSSVTVTNNLVTANSIILGTIATNDATAVLKNIVASAGSFVITLNSAATGETEIRWVIVNQ